MAHADEGTREVRDACVSMVVAVTDEARLRRYAAGLGDRLDPDGPLGPLVAAATSNPHEPAAECGYEVVARVARPLGPDDRGDATFRVDVRATVDDPGAMARAGREAARRSYGEDGDGRDADPDLDGLLYELELASNAGPPDVEAGFEVTSTLRGVEARRLLAGGAARA